ncbi:MAG: hypothetical protein AAFU78_13165 [Cyanobacteria bacterium J06633_2]
MNVSTEEQMNRRDILAIQMALRYGTIGKHMLKEAVNAALDAGEWHEYFYIAVISNDLDDDEAQKLLDCVLNAYPDCVLDVDRLDTIIETHLPQAGLASVSWLVGPDCAFVFTDSLRVAKVEKGSLSWVTERSSWDGIALDRVEDDVVFGSWYDVTSGYKWQPLKLSYDDGKLLQGKVIEF